MKIATRGFAAFGVSVLTAAAIYAVTLSADKHGCAPGPAPTAGASKTAFAYFDALVARPDCMAAYSLRDNAQLQQYKHGGKAAPQLVTYDPANDHDPRKQDAAKLVVPENQVSLKSTERLPIGTEDGTTTLVTWDAWFGSEFQYGNTGIGTYKTFQFASPARIWFEVRTRFKLADEPEGGKRHRANRASKRSKGEKADKNDKGQQSAPAPADTPPARTATHAEIGVVDARAYGARGTGLGPNVETGTPLKPQAGNFTIRGETWTRYWVLIDQRANDWDLVSLWVADENHDPVLIIDKRQLSVNGSVGSFWLEYNTSSAGGEKVGQRVAYVRNVVMLRNPKDVTSLLQRPAH